MCEGGLSKFCRRKRGRHAFQICILAEKVMRVRLKIVNRL